MALKADAEIERVHELLGAGGEVEIVPMFVPMQTYRIILELGKLHGISPADVLVNALIQYARPKPKLEHEPVKEEIQRQPMAQPDIMLRRKKP